LTGQYINGQFVYDRWPTAFRGIITLKKIRFFTNINTFFLLFRNLSPLMNTFSKGGFLAVQKTVSKSLSGLPPFVITIKYVAHTFKYDKTNPFPRNQ